MICPYCKKEISPIEEFTSKVTVVKDKDGRIKTWTEETRDIDGNLIRKRVDEYVYSTSGVIDTICQQVYDGAGTVLSDKILRHNVKGKGLIVETMDERIELKKE
jgi:hypothetical protein